MKRERENHIHMELVPNVQRKSGHQIKISTPSSVLPIHTKEELEAQLKHYSHPFIKHLVPDSKFARKNYVERVRPALRYYCAKFQVPVPKWLKDESEFFNMPHEEKMDFFGTADLKSKEFKKISGKRGAAK